MAREVIRVLGGNRIGLKAVLYGPTPEPKESTHTHYLSIYTVSIYSCIGLLLADTQPSLSTSPTLRNRQKGKRVEKQEAAELGGRQSAQVGGGQYGGQMGSGGPSGWAGRCVTTQEEGK